MGSGQCAVGAVVSVSGCMAAGGGAGAICCCFAKVAAGIFRRARLHRAFRLQRGSKQRVRACVRACVSVRRAEQSRVGRDTAGRDTAGRDTAGRDTAES